MVPVSNNIWVFGAWYGNEYGDNTSYLYEYVKQIKPDIKAVWLTKNKQIINKLRESGDCVFDKNSIYGFWYGSRAGVTFINCGYDDVNRYCLSESFVVQLWHGIPLKKIKNDDTINQIIPRYPFSILLRNLFLKVFPFLDEKFDLIISSGFKVTDRFKSAFKTNGSNIVETGYSRMDIILNAESAYEKEELFKHDKIEIEKYLLYAPTHREEGKGKSNMFSNSGLEKLNKFLQKQNSVMVIKMHYYEIENMTLLTDKEYSHIQLINNMETSDINRILHHIDILITDYSSVFYDFLVLDRPVIFSPFDLDEYQRIDREFYENYADAVPGPVCKNWNEVQIQLEKYFSNDDPYQFKRQKLFNQFYKYSDTDNSKRIINTITQNQNLPT